MSRKWQQAGVALVSGVLFGLGLVLGGMTQPRKVIGFLDIGGAWDPSLAFVMLGAVAVHALGYRLIRGRSAPLFAEAFSLPTRRGVDTMLVFGSALFGVGWGLAGYCPGPAIVSLGSGRIDAILFVAAMLLGMVLAAKFERWQAGRRGIQREGVRADPART